MAQVCTKCNERFDELALKAILVDLGCTVSPSPTKCIDGESHDFEKREADDESE